MSKRKAQEISSSDFDEKFDAGDSILPHLDTSKARRVRPRTRQLRLQMPEWLISALNHEASRRGVALDALLKIWTVERLEREHALVGK